MATYECKEINPATQDCITWQLVDAAPVDTLPISKQDADLLTAGVIGFFISVFIWKQIQKFLK